MSTCIIGHRGSSYVYPENTILAYDKAIEEGAHGIEVDVWPSQDGDLIVLHDHTLDRTTNGSGKVMEHCTKDLVALDAGAWKNPTYEGLETTKLTTLNRILDRYKGQSIFISIQFKSSIHDIRKAITMIDSRGMRKQCLLFANKSWMGQIKKEYPDYFVINDGFHPDGEALLDQAIREDWNAISPGIDNITPKLVTRAHEHDILVQASMIQSDFYNRAIDLLHMDVDILLGDDCAEIVRAVQGFSYSNSCLKA